MEETHDECSETRQEKKIIYPVKIGWLKKKKKNFLFVC